MWNYFEDTRYRRERIFLVFGLPLIFLLVAGLFVLLLRPSRTPAEKPPAPFNTPDIPPAEQASPLPSPATTKPADRKTDVPKAAISPLPPPQAAGPEPVASTPDTTPAPAPSPAEKPEDTRIAQAVAAFEAGDLALARKLIGPVDLSLAHSASAWLLAGVLKEKEGDPSAAMEQRL